MYHGNWRKVISSGRRADNRNSSGLVSSSGSCNLVCESVCVK